MAQFSCLFGFFVTSVYVLILAISSESLTNRAVYWVLVVALLFGWIIIALNTPSEIFQAMFLDDLELWIQLG